jgi:hypothetical protein
MNLSPEMLHQILLSPRMEDVPIQRISKTPSPGFQTYQEQLLWRDVSDPSLVIKRAFHDHMLESVLKNFQEQQQQPPQHQQLTPLRELLLELHQKLRDLVPNRKDLHERLSSDDNLTERDLCQIETLLDLIMESGYALAMLESEVESKTTTAWIEVAKDMTSTLATKTTQQFSKQVSFLICSLLYLIDKADRTLQENILWSCPDCTIPKKGISWN